MIRSWLLFLLLLCASLALLIAYDDKSIGFLLLYSWLLLFLSSVVTVLSAPFSLRLEQEVDKDTLFKSDDCHYQVRLINRGLLFYTRIAYTYRSDDLLAYGQRLPAAIGPLGTLAQEHTIHFPYRGVYPVGVGQVVVADFVGLFRVRIPVRQQPAVTVYPASDDDFTLALQRDSQTVANKTDLMSESYADVADVRGYTEADSFRRIHWKLSARRGELMVKNFHAFDPARMILFLDRIAIPLPAKKRAEMEDKMMACVAGAVSYCAGSRTTAELAYGPGAPTIIDPAEEMDQVYRELAEIAFDGESSLFPALCSEVDQGVGAFNLVAFLSHMDEAVFNAAKSVSSADHNLFLYFFYSDDLPLTQEKAFYLEGLQILGVLVQTIFVQSGDAAL